MAKIIGRQRARSSIDIVDGFFKIFVGFDRQQGPKDLVLHTDGLIIWVNNQRRRKLLCGVIFKVFIGRVNGHRFDGALIGIG